MVDSEAQAFRTLSPVKLGSVDGPLGEAEWSALEVTYAFITRSGQPPVNLQLLAEAAGDRAVIDAMWRLRARRPPLVGWRDASGQLGDQAQPYGLTQAGLRALGV